MQKTAYARIILMMVGGLIVLMLTGACEKLTIVCSFCAMDEIPGMNDKCIPQSILNTGPVSIL
ncbi:hypothetical protein CRX55_28710 [Raoultella planticola]|nr:hypothetical protein CRX55_29035 [Raoultella planticola]PHH22697.1 hypothetical protein CRX55_28710 [Raoultella planticola]